MVNNYIQYKISNVDEDYNRYVVTFSRGILQGKWTRWYAGNGTDEILKNSGEALVAEKKLWLIKPKLKNTIEKEFSTFKDIDVYIESLPPLVDVKLILSDIPNK